MSLIENFLWDDSISTSTNLYYNPKISTFINGKEEKNLYSIIDLIEKEIFEAINEMKLLDSEKNKLIQELEEYETFYNLVQKHLNEENITANIWFDGEENVIDLSIKISGYINTNKNFIQDSLDKIDGSRIDGKKTIIKRILLENIYNLLKFDGSKTTKELVSHLLNNNEIIISPKKSLKKNAFSGYKYKSVEYFRKKYKLHNPQK